jgi:hypothetical protein
MSEKNLETSQNRLSLDRELKQGLQEYEGKLRALHRDVR